MHSTRRVNLLCLGNDCPVNGGAVLCAGLPRVSDVRVFPLCREPILSLSNRAICRKSAFRHNRFPLSDALSPPATLLSPIENLPPQEADDGGREEWMLVPPKSLGVLGAIKTLQPTNRKFQTWVTGGLAILVVHKKNVAYRIGCSYGPAAGGDL